MQIYQAVCTYMEGTTEAKSHLHILCLFCFVFSLVEIQMVIEVRTVSLWCSCLASHNFYMPKHSAHAAYPLCPKLWKITKLASYTNWKLVLWREIPPCQLYLLSSTYTWPDSSNPTWIITISSYSNLMFRSKYNLEPLLNERLRHLWVFFLLLAEGSEGEQNLIHIFIFASLLFSNLRNIKNIKRYRDLYCNSMWSLNIIIPREFALYA